MASLPQVWQRCKTSIVGVRLIIWKLQTCDLKLLPMKYLLLVWTAMSKMMVLLPPDKSPASKVRTWGARARLSYQEADQFVLDLQYGVRLPLQRWRTHTVKFVPPKYRWRKRKCQMWCLCIIWVTFHQTLNATRCSLTTILSSSINRSLNLTP